MSKRIGRTAIEDPICEKLPSLVLEKNMPQLKLVSYMLERSLETGGNTVVTSREFRRYMDGCGCMKKRKRVLPLLKQLRSLIQIYDKNTFRPTMLSLLIVERYKKYVKNFEELVNIRNTLLADSEEILGDAEVAMTHLDAAQISGLCHATHIRYQESLGRKISETDLRRIEEYKKIEQLRSEDINEQNADWVLEAERWAMWLPKIKYNLRPERVYHCPSCGSDVKPWTAIYPDGTWRTSLSIHKKMCTERILK